MVNDRTSIAPICKRVFSVGISGPIFTKCSDDVKRSYYFHSFSGGQTHLIDKLRTMLIVLVISIVTKVTYQITTTKNNPEQHSLFSVLYVKKSGV